MELWDEMKGMKLNRKIVIERNEMDSQVWNEGTMGQNEIESGVMRSIEVKWVGMKECFWNGMRWNDIE